MFEGLSKRLGDVFDKLRGRGALSEADVDAALREVRTALLEADVALPVVRQFIDSVRPKAIGADVIRSVTPGQMVVKIVNDHLVEMLGGTVTDLDLNAIPPAAIESIEILKDGASSIYGADAIAGVVNIKLRHDYRGAELSFEYGNTTDRDSSELKTSLVFGVGNDMTNITGVAQLWQVPVEGGWPVQLTFTNESVNAGRFSLSCFGGKFSGGGTYQAKFGDYPRLGSVVGYAMLKSAAAILAKAHSTDSEKLVDAEIGRAHV